MFQKKKRFVYFFVIIIYYIMYTEVHYMPTLSR